MELNDDLRHFKGDNGKSYNVPAGEVESFLESAKGDGVTVEEIGQQKPVEQTLSFRGNNGKTYKVPSNEVEDFRKTAANDGVELTQVDDQGNDLPKEMKFKGDNGKTYVVPTAEVEDFRRQAAADGVALQEMKDLGVLGTLKTQKEAEFGRKLGAGEAALSYVPIINTGMSANEKRKEDVLRRLYEGDYKNYLEGVQLAQSVDMPAEVLAKIRDAATQNGPRNLLGGAMKADEETAATMFKEWAGPLLAERIKAREEAQQKLANNDTGLLEDATVGLVGGASALASMASVPLAAATLPMDAINRGGGLRHGQWTVDENGNPSRAQLVDEKGQPKVNSDGTPVVSQGDSDAAALAKGFAGAAAERFIWMGLGKVVKSVGGALMKNVPGLDKMLGKVAGKPLAWSAGLEKKLSESEGGRWLLKTGEILSNVNDTIHVGSLPSMMLKSRLTELADDVVGLNVANEGDREKFMDWAKKFVSVDDNVELLTSLIGLHVAMGGYSALRARSANKAFRADARKVLVNYLDDAQMDKMSNEDLQGLYRILQAPGLTAERAAKFLEDCRAEQAEARQKVESGEKLTEVKEGLDTLAQRSDRFIEGAEKVVDKMKSDEQKIIEAAEQARNQAIRQAEWEENNRRVEEQQRSDELSRIRGAEPSEQVAELEKRGVTSWEDAREKQLIGQDEQGRWTGGARQAINIHLNGSEKMKAAVKNGEISGDLAEELLTLGYCELGNRPKAERDAMIDRIIDECNGDADAARARIAELKGNLYGDEALAPGETRQPETAYEGAVNAERMKGTELRSEDGALLGCERFKDVKISINEDGIITTGLTDALMSAPENQADVAALLVRLNAISEKTGLPINFGGDENALRVANGIMDAVEREGLAKVQKKMDTRSQLFGTLMKTTLGNGVTYDETSFKAALEKTGNGRQFVDNHGNVYGFVDSEGIIHFNPTAINYNTPIHEYGHVALEAVKKINGNLWKKGMDLVKDSPYYRELLDEIGKEKDSPYSKFSEDYLRDEALARMIGDKGERLVEGKGLGAELKAWLREFWQAFKGAFGVADLTDEQIDKMTLGDFVDAINAELLRGKEFGTKKAQPLEKRSIRRFDEDQNSGSNGMLRWKNDRGYLFAIPVDMERTQPGGKVVFARDDANVTDWIQNALNGYTLRLSKSGKLYVEGRDGLPPELAEIFGRYPTIGMNDGIFEQIASETGNRAINGAARDMTPEALVEALRKDRESYNSWTRDRNAEAEHWENEQAREEAEAQQRWEQSGMSVVDYVRSRAEEGDPAFDLDWETAREIERDRAAGRFAVKDRQTPRNPEPEIVERKIADLVSGKINRINGDKIVYKESENDNRKLSDEAAKVYRQFSGKKFPLPTGANLYFAPDSKTIEAYGGDVALAWGEYALHLITHRRGSEGNLYRSFDGKTVDVVLPNIQSIIDENHVKASKGRIVFYKQTTKADSKTKSRYACIVAEPDANGDLRVDMRYVTGMNERGFLPGNTATLEEVIQNRTAEGRALHLDQPTTESITQSRSAGNGLAKMSVGRLYTGSAADYEKPSLLKVGTGEGSQVYGWGLYASDRRGVAEGYAERGKEKFDVFYKGKPIEDGDAKAIRDIQKVVRDAKRHSRSVEEMFRQYIDTLNKPDALGESYHEQATELRNLLEFYTKTKKDWTVDNGHKNTYEQTFFTNRAPGDESHLLKWYEPVSEEQKAWIEEQAKKEGFVVDYSIRGEKYIAGPNVGGLAASESGIIPEYWQTGEDAYRAIGRLLGSPKAASEFLARADIDGIKYPVDSYGGNTVKDGDKAGWNYVSFRDDNIRVDHKWRDGQALFSAGSASPRFNRRNFIAGRAMVAEDYGRGERTPGAMAASRELDAQHASPIAGRGDIRRISLPLSEIEQLRRQVTSDAVPAHLGRRIPGGAAAIHNTAGRLFMNADVFGVIDKTDEQPVKDDLKQHGFFMNEDPNWQATHTAREIAHEKNRSEKQLAIQLNNLAKRRTDGTEPGGFAAARQVFADQVAAIVCDMPQPMGGTLGKVQTVGKGLRAELKNLLKANGVNAADVETAMRGEAGAFLDWAYGGPIVDPATGATTSRGDAHSVADLTGRMFGAWLVMPDAMERQAPRWTKAIETTIANTPKLARAFRGITFRNAMSEQATASLIDRIRRQQSIMTEKTIAKLRQEVREPISAGSKVADAKETLLVAFDDKFSPVYIRVDEKVKNYVKAKKEALKTATSPAAKAAIQLEIDTFMGDIGRKMHKLELSRTAYERGAWNEGRRYFMQMVLLENKASAKWGLAEEDRSLYLDLQRIIETQGRSGSDGMSPRQAQIALGDMARRLGASKWRLLQQYGDEFFHIHEREILDDPRLERALGKSFVDYCRTQTHYVATKRTWSMEEIDAIETAREAARRAGVAGGDDVISQMYAFAGKRGAGSVVGEGVWTARLNGSMAAKQEVRSATWEKADPLMQFGRRNQMVLDLKDALLAAEVTGVRDLRRTDGTEYPADPKGRYGHINYMENGEKRVLVVPRQIADAFRIDPDNAQFLTKVNGLVRSCLIDYNVAYTPQNVRRNQDSLEKNMPGMRETYLKTGLRAAAPGVAPIVDLTSQYLVRKFPTMGNLFGKHTVFFHLPKAERWAKIVEDPTGWQQELWAAEAAHDNARVTQCWEDFSGVMEMLKGNLLVPTGKAYANDGKTNGFAFDVMDRKGLKTLEMIDKERQQRGKYGNIVNKINIFKKNQAQNEHEDLLAKTVGYLHDRMFYGAQRNAAESGLMVKRNVSIAEGERSGRLKRGIQGCVAQFFNMVEKGVVRHWRNFGERPGEMLVKDGKVWMGRAIGGMLAYGCLQKWLLSMCGDDEEKAKEKFGKVYDYAAFCHRAYQNCSDYVKENYNFTPIWMSEDGWTTLIMGGALTDEDKLIVPTADYFAKWVAFNQGIGERPSLGTTIANSTFKAITPDLQLAAPAVSLLRDTIEAAFLDNPTDYFRNAPMYDNDLWKARNESWEIRGKFAAAVAGRLWNDFGGRAIYAADVNGVDSGRGSAPSSLETILRKIPVLSPAISRLFKIQVGSPEKLGAPVTAERDRMASVINVCAKDLMDEWKGDLGYHERDPKGFEEKIQKWTERYGFTPYDAMKLKEKYYNAWIQRKCRGAYDQKKLMKLFQEGLKQGRDQNDMWLMMGEL